MWKYDTKYIRNSYQIQEKTAKCKQPHVLSGICTRNTKNFEMPFLNIKKIKWLLYSN